MKYILPLLYLFSLSACPAAQDPEKDYDQRGRRAAQRDAFPVFNNPKMVDAAEAEKKGYVRAADFVIGVKVGDEAKCYPIPIMGVHELGNDKCGGKPIAVSW